METFCLLTIAANTMASKIHDRMPVILTGKAVDLWLDHSLKDLKPPADLLKPALEKLLTTVAVSTVVNSPKNDTPRCVEPIEAT